MLTANDVSSLVSNELARITDPALHGRIRGLLILPYPVERDWAYGRVGERFTCWTVLEPAFQYCYRILPTGLRPRRPLGTRVAGWRSHGHWDGQFLVSHTGISRAG
jgi:hypothetical protein